MVEPRPVLKDDAIYLGDNGRCFCGKHAGASARFTGRDLSGQPVAETTNPLFKNACEDCRRERASAAPRPSPRRRRLPAPPPLLFDVEELAALHEAIAQFVENHDEDQDVPEAARTAMGKLDAWRAWHAEVKARP